MNITLLKYTEDADSVLIFSKRTRKEMSAGGFHDVMMMPREEKEKELDYVFSTIGSSWEFVDYIFMIEDVTRAFTHQLVRHRVGVSFAQQTMRMVDMTGFRYLATGDCENNQLYKDTMLVISTAYDRLVKEGIKPEDARGILPTNILTNILMKINLRALSDLCSSRLCMRAQGEFRQAVVIMRDLVADAHPWAARVLKPHCELKGSCQFPRYMDCPRKTEGGGDEKSS